MSNRLLSGLHSDIHRAKKGLRRAADLTQDVAPGWAEIGRLTPDNAVYNADCRCIGGGTGGFPSLTVKPLRRNLNTTPFIWPIVVPARRQLRWNVARAEIGPDKRSNTGQSV
jgi:hypothetical protein